MHIICSALIWNLWVASVEDFASSDIFSKKDLIDILVTVWAYVVNTIISERPLYEIEWAALQAGSTLIWLMFDIFVIDDYINPDQFLIK